MDKHVKSCEKARTLFKYSPPFFFWRGWGVSCLLEHPAECLDGHKTDYSIFFGWAARLRSIPSLVRLWRKRTNEGWPKEEWRWAKSTKMIFKRCKKAPKKPPARKKKVFCFFTAQLSLSFSGEKGSGVQNDLFISPPFFFPHNFFPMRCPWPRTFVESETRRRIFFFFQFLSTRVFAFWQLAAGQPHWTLIQLSWIELFQIELNFFLNELNFFHPWRIAKESNQTTKKPIKEERWKTKQKKERSGFSINA